MANTVSQYSCTQCTVFVRLYDTRPPAVTQCLHVTWQQLNALSRLKQIAQCSCLLLTVTFPEVLLVQTYKKDTVKDGQYNSLLPATKERDSILSADRVCPFQAALIFQI